MIIEDQLDRGAGRISGVETLEEFDELPAAVAVSDEPKWRCCEARLFDPAFPFGTAEGPAAVTVGRAENRSGVVSAGRRVGMPPTMPPVAHRGNSWQDYNHAARPIS